MKVTDLQIRRIETDVLIIGTGGAGLYAARAAVKQGASVLIVSKDVPGRGSATFVAGGIAASGPPPDSVEQHFLDTVKGGAELNDDGLVQLMVEDVNAQLDELDALGVRFDRDAAGNRVRKRRGGHSHPRHCTALSDAAGRETVLALQRSLDSSRTRVAGDLFISTLLLADGAVVGATALDLRSGELVDIKAGATVVATGGAGGLFPVTSMPRGASGDGYALAARAGAELRDMEMVAFHPGGFYVPGMLHGLSCREPSHFAAMGGRLVNGLGQPFLHRYDPRGEFATRDVLVRAEYAEIVAGRGSPNGGVYLDLSGLPKEARLALPHESPRLYNQCKVAGLEVAERDDWIEIGPSVYYNCGGVVVDRNGRTTVPQLFACGEVVGGVHGANRLAGNAMAELLTLAPRAGAAAAERALEGPAPSFIESRLVEERDRICALLRPSGVRSVELEQELQDTMWRNVGVIRYEGGLKTAEVQLHTLRASAEKIGVAGPAAPYNLGLLHALETLNLLDVGELVAASARCRQESRGSHFREDYPQRDDSSWQVSVVCQRVRDSLRVWTVPIGRA